jgi:protein TonB
MARAGFYEETRFSPMGLGLVIAMHIAALGALALVKGPEFFQPPTPLDIFDVPIPPEPKADAEPPPPRDEPRPQLPPVLDRTPPVVPPINDNFADSRDATPDIPSLEDGAGTAFVADRVELPPPPVRLEAQWDSRFAAERQPPYPSSEQRAERDGTVRVELTIGADGRVKAIHRLRATSEAFWRATERHALAHWRFRPATLDGRPVESTKVMNIYFRIEA